MQKMIVTGSLLLLATQALAHHPLAGMPMESFTDGFLSGVGHPLLGFDHLFFVMLVGIAAILTGRRLLAPLAYILTMLVGCVVTALWAPVPATELMIALSLLVLGSMLLSGHRFGLSTVLIAFAGFGLFHGAAFGESLATQEAGFGLQVLTGYLLGLGLTQLAVAVATGLFCMMLWKVSHPRALQPRLAGAMVAGIGLYLTLEHFEDSLIRVISS
ncbi:MAG: HupE/UreJ family protein [Gammaproteobacteria bacterium]|nr:HupE/UreJ family protein [Gammaproteobacteria bacterium]MDH3856959.1 HupE/UreJ family protein [Gammaproteobacteria bacterium]